MYGIEFDSDLSIDDAGIITGSGFFMPPMRDYVPYIMNGYASSYFTSNLGDGFSALVSFGAIGAEPLKDLFGIDFEEPKLEAVWRS